MILVSHQIHKTQAIIATHHGRIGKNLGKMSLLERPKRKIVVHVISHSVLCIGKKTTPLQTKHGRQLSEARDSVTFVDEYPITVRSVQFHWLIFLPLSAPNHEINSNILGVQETARFEKAEAYSCGYSKHVLQTQERLPNTLIEVRQWCFR